MTLTWYFPFYYRPGVSFYHPTSNVHWKTFQFLFLPCFSGSFSNYSYVTMSDEGGRCTGWLKTCKKKFYPLTKKDLLFRGRKKLPGFTIFLSLWFLLQLQPCHPPPCLMSGPLAIKWQLVSQIVSNIFSFKVMLGIPPPP